MSTDRRAWRPLVSRRLAEIVTVLILAFVMQAGVFPFNFTTAPSAGARVFFTTATHDLLLPDIVSNIILYIPVGLCCVWVTTRGMRSAIIALCVAIAVGAILSGTVELAQAFLPSRVSSAIDLAANVSGAATGAVLAIAARWTLPRLIGAWLYELHTAPRLAFTKAYVLALLVITAAPFTFTFDATRLFRSVCDAHLIPFASLHTAPTGANVGDSLRPNGASTDRPGQPGVPTEPRALAAFVAWQRLRLPAHWAAEAMSFLVLGLLVGTVMRHDYEFGARATAALTAWVCGGLAVVMSALNIFISTRAFDSTDILFRVTGSAVAIGIMALFDLREIDWRAAALERADMIRRLATAGVGAYVVYVGLIPFRLEMTGERVFRSMIAASLLPFASYDVARFDVMLADLFEKVLSWALLAVSLATVRRTVYGATAGSRLSSRAIAGTCAFTSAIIELTQFFSPVRTASLTDPIVAGVSALVGVALYRRVIRFLEYATAHDMLEPAAPARRRQQRAMSPTDELIATLMDEQEDAPVERLPEPEREPRH